MPDGSSEPRDAPGLRQERPGSSAYRRTSTACPSALVALATRALAVGDADLLLDEVDARDELRHRVLDLDAAVQLEEVEVAAVDHEFGRPCAAVTDGAAERDRGVAHRLPELVVDRRRGRLLEHLLVASLDRAVALAERDDGAGGVGEQLDLDVARPLDVALAEDAIVSEGGSRLPARGGERLLELAGRANDSHAASAAARGGLDHERIADIIRLPVRHDGDAGLSGDVLRGELVAALPQRLRRRPDEDRCPAPSTASASSALSARKP